MTKINTILQCFVDTNLELDENLWFSFSNLPKISFDQRIYDTIEGQVVDIKFSLDAPSENGLEEVEIAIIANNTSAADFSTLGETYPKTFIFSAGQQTQTISFLVNTDLFEDPAESFDVIFGNFTNVTPGQYITTTINIIDNTNLKEVSINEQGGVVNNGVLEFLILEGATKNVIVSLDSPSTLGVESIDIQFSNISTNSGDFTYGGSTTLSWSIGEQNKTLTIEANGDQEIEDNEILRIQLLNPVNVNIASFDSADINIEDSSPNTRYAVINLQGTYIQKGNLLPNVEARYIRRNSTTSYSDNTYRMFIRFGDFIEQNWQTFDPPNTNSSAPVCAENCITGYNAGQLDAFQQDSKIFFGKNPDTGEYGDLRLRIKNVGSHPAKISGSTIAVNDSITVNIDEFEYKIKLPANSVLLSGGTFYNGTPLVEDTLTECLYEFTFEIDYDGLNFVLRDSDNSVSSNKEFQLGTHNFSETYTFSDADLPQNQHMLVSEYSNVWPYWEENPVWPQTSPYCLPAGTPLNQDPIYPTDQGDLQNVYIDGIMFLHQTLSNQNSTNATKTNHVNISFWPSGQTAADNGCSSVNIQYDFNVFSPTLQTTSIPFKVIV